MLFLVEIIFKIFMGLKLAEDINGQLREDGSLDRKFRPKAFRRK